MSGRMARIRDGIARQLVRAGSRFAVEYQPWDDFWYSPEPVSGNDVPVTPETAMRLSTCHASIRITGNLIGVQPAFCYERLAGGARRVATEQRAHQLLHERPNEYQTPFEFKRELGVMLAARGNSYNEKIFSGRLGAGVEQLWPIHPDHVKPDWLNRRTGRRKIYDVSSAHDGRARVLSAERVWHPHLLSMDGGLSGASPIRLAAEGLSIGLISQRFTQRLLRNNARPGGVLSSEKVVNDTQAEAIKQRWREMLAGERQGDIAVLSLGAKFQTVTITPEDAQLAELMNWSIADLARIWGMPLWVLQHEQKDTSWGSGLAQMDLGFAKYTTLPYDVLIEEGASLALLEDPTRFFVELQMDVLLRSDLEARFKAYQLAVNANNPWMTRNQIRRLENWDPDPSPEGDKFLRPENNLGGGKQPAKNGQSAALLASLEQVDAALEHAAREVAR